MTVTRSDFIDLPHLKLILFPFWSISLRFLNFWLLTPWLPEPALYSFQVKSEIRYQTRTFIDQSLQALDRINARFPLLGSSSNPTIEAAITTVENYQQHLTSTRESHQPFSLLARYFLRKPEALLMVEEQLALTNRIRDHLLAVLKTLQVYETDSVRLRSQLQDLRKDFNPPKFEFSPKGLVAVPASLLDEVQHSPFEWHEDRGGDQSARHLLTPHPHVYFYDLDDDDGSRPEELRLALASLCRSRKNTDILSGALYMICTIWAHAATMSAFDKNTLGSVQRSWVVERMEAVQRHEQRTGANHNSIIDVMLKTHRDHKRGIPVPPSL
ncbi:MAG: hypothetical protein OHK93_003348 [Ramalina farinacea]|uniref:Uncharacterized protein n=1 Tax=Ramalina farinacea TaxID=258253 RepID=A0AA43TUL2_9LECA|nr:hypothetical protein [Ramalina farinacea]